MARSFESEHHDRCCTSLNYVSGSVPWSTIIVLLLRYSTSKTSEVQNCLRDDEEKENYHNAIAVLPLCSRALMNMDCIDTGRQIIIN